MIKNKVVNELTFLIKIIFLFGVLLAITCILSEVMGDILATKELEMIENDQVLVTAKLELIGMQMLQQFPAKIEVFFLIIMVLNLIVMGSIIGHSVHATRKCVMQGGAFGFFYIQTMNIWLYFGMIMLLVLLTALLTWGIYVTEVFVASSFLLSGADPAVLFSVNRVLMSMACLGVGIVVLMVSISILYGVKQFYSMHSVDFGIGIMGLFFALGNAYKIPQMIGQNQIEKMINAQQTMEVTRALKQIRFLCPFSWINPFNIYNHILSSKMFLLYVMVALVVLIIAGVVFCFRDWQEL